MFGVDFVYVKLEAWGLSTLGRTYNSQHEDSNESQHEISEGFERTLYVHVS